MFTYQLYTVAQMKNKNMHGETHTTIKVAVHSEYEPYRSNGDNFDTNPLRIIQTTSRTILYHPYKTQPAATHISSIQSELRYALYESQAEWSDSWRGKGRIRQISRTLSYPFEPLRTIHFTRVTSVSISTSEWHSLIAECNHTHATNQIHCLPESIWECDSSPVRQGFF